MSGFAKIDIDRKKKKKYHTNSSQRFLERRGKIMQYDYSKLRGKIVETYGTIAEFCREHELNNQNISKKLNNVTHFSIDDALELSNYLSIPKEEIHRYFFVVKIGNELKKEKFGKSV